MEMPGAADFQPSSNDSGHASALIDALASGLVRVLISDDDARRGLADLSGRVIAVHLRDTAGVLYVHPTAAGVKLAKHHAGEPDVRIAVRLRDLVAVVRAHRNGDALAAGQVDIQGDLATAQRVQTILAELNLDWEEFLSTYIGDIAARQLGRAVRGFARWISDAGAVVEQDLSEYLRHEIALLPTRAEHDVFLDMASRLTSDVERFGARIRRLRDKLGQA